jgi:hypothetical protein
MAASVQGWRTKWFYIKDRKVSSSDEYGLAPFDASQELKKLTGFEPFGLSSLSLSWVPFAVFNRFYFL